MRIINYLILGIWCLGLLSACSMPKSHLKVQAYTDPELAVPQTLKVPANMRGTELGTDYPVPKVLPQQAVDLTSVPLPPRV